MSGPDAGWTSEQLRQALAASPGLSPARPATITVERLDRVGPGAAGVLAEITVADERGVEQWRLTFDSMWADLCDLPLQDAALIARANIEEWWDTRSGEPTPPWLTEERIG